VKPIQQNLPAAQQGNYIVTGIPHPGTYTVEVRAVAGDSSPYTGNGPTVTANTANQQITAIDVCVHGNATPPPA
jgi:hypothetical protein